MGREGERREGRGREAGKLGGMGHMGNNRKGKERQRGGGREVQIKGIKEMRLGREEGRGNKNK